MAGSQFKFESVEMDILDSITFDKEAWLEAIVEKSGLTPEEFGVYYVIEEYPMKFDFTMDFSLDDNTIRATQEFRFRLKTPEEMQLELESGEQTDESD